MKCPECSYDQKAKYGLKCDGCGYEFTFNPKDPETPGFTDGKFKACLRAASQNDTKYYTENQLYAVYCRREAPNTLPFMILATLLLIVGGCLGFTPFPYFGLAPAAFGVIILLDTLRNIIGNKRLNRDHFQTLLNKWRENGHKTDRMIMEPALHDPPPEWNETDIYDYGVERLLIVEHDILVDLLVKNEVHADQRMLVLSETGYPGYLLPLARRLLEERLDLPVFLLHDATDHGIEMEQRLTASRMLPLDGHPVTDLGMHPADFQKLKRTKHYASNDKTRALPVDAMLLPFLTAGLGTAMAQDISLGNLIQASNKGSAYDGGFDFG